MRPSGVGEGLLGRLSQGRVWERGELPEPEQPRKHGKARAVWVAARVRRSPWPFSVCFTKVDLGQ